MSKHDIAIGTLLTKGWVVFHQGGGMRVTFPEGIPEIIGATYVVDTEKKEVIHYNKAHQLYHRDIHNLMQFIGRELGDTTQAAAIKNQLDQHSAKWAPMLTGYIENLLHERVTEEERAKRISIFEAAHVSNPFKEAL